MKGTPIPTNDIWIAAQAMETGADLLSYDQHFGSEPSTGYETLLYDAMIGDSTLFQRNDIVEAAWTMATPIQDVWQTLPPRNFPNYPARNAWGPPEAEELIRREGGRKWWL